MLGKQNLHVQNHGYKLSHEQDFYPEAVCSSSILVAGNGTFCEALVCLAPNLRSGWFNFDFNKPPVFKAGHRGAVIRFPTALLNFLHFYYFAVLLYLLNSDGLFLMPVQLSFPPIADLYWTSVP